MSRIRFYFPDGLLLEIHAEAEIIEQPDGSRQFRATPLESDTSGEIPIIAGMPMYPDPRCLCADMESGEVIYNPLDHKESMPTEMREFLDSNPDWPFKTLSKSLAGIRKSDSDEP